MNALWLVPLTHGRMIAYASRYIGIYSNYPIGSIRLCSRIQDINSIKKKQAAEMAAAKKAAVRTSLDIPPCNPTINDRNALRVN